MVSTVSRKTTNCRRIPPIPTLYPCTRLSINISLVWRAAGPTPQGLYQRTSRKEKEKEKIGKSVSSKGFKMSRKLGKILVRRREVERDTSTLFAAPAGKKKK